MYVGLKHGIDFFAINLVYKHRFNQFRFCDLDFTTAPISFFFGETLLAKHLTGVGNIREISSFYPPNAK